MGYGMRMPYNEVEFLNELDMSRDTPSARYDIGVNMDTGSIPLFELNSDATGSLYSMLGNVGAGYGSVMYLRVTMAEYMTY